MVNWGSLIFGGVDSSDYGIYITGEAVYNAPSRVVELVEVPGRNGSVAIDQGRYENITVTYPCGTFRTTQEEFRRNLANFRNAIMSQTGYQRLEDSYHPLDYREAVYHSGFEVSPVMYGTAGEFELSFDCKPQRFLKSGEVAIPVTTSDAVENPTLFNSHPLLEIEGYGLIQVNDYSITISNDTMGETTLISPFSLSGEDLIYQTFTLNSNLFEDNDTMTIPSITFRTVVEFDDVISSISGTLTETNITDTSMEGTSYKNNYCYVNLVFPEKTLTLSKSSVYSNTYQSVLSGDCVVNAVHKYFTIIANYTLAKANAGTDEPITLDFQLYFAPDSGSAANVLSHQIGFQVSKDVTVDSSLSILGTPLYIDCEIGEVYKYENDTVINLNSRITLGSELPVLVPGINTFYAPNTITAFKVVPRWWKI